VFSSLWSKRKEPQQATTGHNRPPHGLMHWSNKPLASKSESLRGERSLAMIWYELVALQWFFWSPNTSDHPKHQKKCENMVNKIETFQNMYFMICIYIYICVCIMYLSLSLSLSATRFNYVWFHMSIHFHTCPITESPGPTIGQYWSKLVASRSLSASSPRASSTWKAWPWPHI